MTREQALARLLTLWCVGVAILGAILLAQSASGKYGADDGLAWNWFLGPTAANLSLVTTGYFASARTAWRNGTAHRTKFWLAAAGSALLLVAMAVILLAEPFLELTSFELFAKTGNYLVLLQALPAAALAALVFDDR